MGQVAFWGPVHGQVGVTTNLIAISTLIGLEYMTKTLISHTHLEMSPLESIFSKEKPNGENSTYDYDARGIDALERLARSKRLTPDLVKDHATIILQDRLDLLLGTTKRHEELFANLTDVVPSILAAAKQYYNMSLIDVNSGTKNNLTKTVLDTSDLVVVNLNQNVNVLEKFFNDKPAFLNGKDYIIVLGQYDKNSKYTVSNIKRGYKCSTPIFTIPHCSGFMDACNDRTVVEFFLKNKNIGSSHDNFFFLSEVRRMAKSVLEASGVNTKLYSEQGA
jgi:MinD-like ATPase involved in chromosome partitioning or flagellar assembly